MVLARCYALQGDSAKSPTAYQDFFANWKDADPDVPTLSLQNLNTQNCNNGLIRGKGCTS